MELICDVYALNFVLIILTLIGISAAYYIFTSNASDNMDLEFDYMLFRNQNNFM